MELIKKHVYAKSMLKEAVYNKALLNLLWLFYSFSGSFSGCRSSETDRGNEDGDGQLGLPCQFPFILNKKIYYACTYDYGHLTGYKPWCATDTDENNNYISGKVLSLHCFLWKIIDEKLSKSHQALEYSIYNV